MKRANAVILMLIVLGASGCNPCTSFLGEFVSGIEKLFYNKDKGEALLAETREQVATAEDMIWWFWSMGFEYEEDPLWGIIDYQSDPWVSIQTKDGDCEDISFLINAILKGRYEESCVLVMTGSPGHAVFAYSISCTWWCLSGTTRIYGPYETLEDVAAARCPMYDDLYIMDRYVW